MGLEGRTWLELGGLPKERWTAVAGIPFLQERETVRGNDCVIRLGKSGEDGSEEAREAVGVRKDALAGGLSVKIGGVERAEGASPGGSARSVSPWLMNRAAGVAEKLPAAEIERRLRREGLQAELAPLRSGGQAVWRRRFRATVFDLLVVDARRVLFERGTVVNDINYVVDDRLRNIVAKAATRALYALGLDFGEVDVELDDWGKATIAGVGVTLAPTKGAAEDALGAAVSAFAAAWAAETRDGTRVTLGADPEFVMLGPDGKVVPASRFFPRDGDAGCDSVVIRGVRRWPLAELRPAPATEPAAVAKDLRRLLGEAARRTAGTALSWRAGAGPVRGLPLGGHVHVSGAVLTGERLRALDNAVALPLRLLEPPSAAARRPRFGALGDFRRQSHGGFEYRTPPSWLVSPRLARGVLALAKVAAEHSRDLAPARPLDDDAVRDAFYAGDREALLAGFAIVREALAGTAGYRKYEAMISPLFEAIDRGRTWNETADLRERWGIAVL